MKGRGEGEKRDNPPPLLTFFDVTFAPHAMPTGGGIGSEREGKGGKRGRRGGERKRERLHLRPPPSPLSGRRTFCHRVLSVERRTVRQEKKGGKRQKGEKGEREKKKKGPTSPCRCLRHPALRHEAVSLGPAPSDAGETRRRRTSTRT